jgi:RNA polymerase sigma-70 factor, ECF subfamily
VRYQDFSALAASYLAQLYNTARRMTGDAHEAEDLVQETYERAFQAWRQLKDPAHCRAWLYQIMRNLFNVSEHLAGMPSVSPVQKRWC